MNVPVGSVFGTLQAYLGSYYVNQFNKFGRTYQVYVQADSRYRLEPDDIRRLHVRNTKGQMVPLGTMTDVSFTTAPAVITLYNLFPAAPINGMAAPGYSSGQALQDHGGHGPPEASRRHGLRVDGHVLPGEARGQPGDLSSSRSPPSWSSWCWPPSTRAGPTRRR